jgi:hypothetical protein
MLFSQGWPLFHLFRGERSRTSGDLLASFLATQFGSAMSGVVKASFLLFVGLALGVCFNEWPITGDAVVTATGDLGVIDMMSYAAGLVAGMVLWQIGSVPWVELPGKVQHYMAAQMHFYQFVVVGGACVHLFLKRVA